MRRQRPRRPVIRLGPLEIDTGRKQVSRRGDALHLTPSEYRLLAFLAQRPGSVISQRRLIQHLHTNRSTVSSNVLEVLVSGLRRQTHVQGEPTVLRTRRGLGYFVE